MTVKDLTAADLSDATTYMQVEAEKRWYAGYRQPNRKRTLLVAQWCRDELIRNDGRTFTPDELYRLAQTDTHFVDQVGSIWLMLLGKLLIELFLLWLANRKEKP